MLEIQPKALKTRMIPWNKKNLSQKMAHWVGAQGQATSAKKRKTRPLVTSLPENHKPKTKFFFQSQVEDLPNP